jgi:hypothetical protein
LKDQISEIETNSKNKRIRALQSERTLLYIPIHKRGDKTDCSNYRGISPLSTTDNILTSILLSRLTPYVDEIIGYHQCGFRRIRSTTDQIMIMIIMCSSNTGENGSTVGQYSSYL